MNMKELLEKVGKELYDYINASGIVKVGGSLTLSIVEDNFVIKEDRSYGDYLYMVVNRSTWEVDKISMGKQVSLKEINEFCKLIINALSVHAAEFDKVFGVKLESIEDFQNNVVKLLESGIDKRYVIGKKVKREKHWSDSQDYFDEYGIVFNPKDFFSIDFDRDDERDGANNQKFYCEWARETIDAESLGLLLGKIVEKNKDIINRYIEEGKE